MRLLLLTFVIGLAACGGGGTSDSENAQLAAREVTGLAPGYALGEVVHVQDDVWEAHLQPDNDDLSADNDNLLCYAIHLDQWRGDPGPTIGTSKCHVSRVNRRRLTHWGQ